MGCGLARRPGTSEAETQNGGMSRWVHILVTVASSSPKCIAGLCGNLLGGYC